MSIKYQVLADFAPNPLNEEDKELMKMQGQQESKPWIIYVDDSGNMKGSGLGLVLTSTCGDVVEKAVWCGFKETNNEAEYEVLIAGLKLAIEMKIKNSTYSVTHN